MQAKKMFKTKNGQIIPAVTADQMREVDRIAMEDFGLGVLQMMENAGRSLAQNVIEMLGSTTGEVTILAGAGGNGGGGICSARHLHNRGFKVHIVLDRDPAELRGSALAQHNILKRAGLAVTHPKEVAQRIRSSEIVIDALIGYSLRGVPTGMTADLISLANEYATRILSLDLPSGINATTGVPPGVAIQPERTLTLALPKTGLRHVEGELYLADIGIPPEVYHALDIHFAPLFGDQYWILFEVEE
jgi:NAD(P)H-hydrate epimerase